ncbi:MAG: hypothetical protein ACRDH9_13205 [Actinomycetota bacterium]
MNQVRRRVLALILGVAAMSSMIGTTPAQAARVLIYAGSCDLRVTFHLNAPIGAGTFGNPGYWIEVRPLTALPPCQLSDDPLDPLRTTTVVASGSSSLFNCDSVVAAGGWSQSWQKSGGTYSPTPVSGGRHKLYGTYDNWILETEGPTVVNFAGVTLLTVDPFYAGMTAAACSNGSLWELHTIGTQVFEDPQL